MQEKSTIIFYKCRILSLKLYDDVLCILHGKKDFFSKIKHKI